MGISKQHINVYHQFLNAVTTHIPEVETCQEFENDGSGGFNFDIEFYDKIDSTKLESEIKKHIAENNIINIKYFIYNTENITTLVLSIV